MRHDHARIRAETAIDGFGRDAEPSLRHQSQDRAQVAQPGYCRRYPDGIQPPRSASLAPLEEAAAVTFRQKTLLPLDDCLHALQREVPSLTRSSLHRLYQRHGISQLPKAGDQKREKKPLKRYPIGYLHIDISGVCTWEGKTYLFVAVDRTSKFLHAQLDRKMTRQIAADFLEDTLKMLPYRAQTMLTENGVQFAKKAGAEAYKPHVFDVVCYRHGIEHRLTKPFHPWTNGQVERMNRTIKEATTRALHYTSLKQLQSHLEDYLWAYNSARPLRALKDKTPVSLSLNNGKKSLRDFMMTRTISLRDQTPRRHPDAKQNHARSDASGN